MTVTARRKNARSWQQAAARIGHRYDQVLQAQGLAAYFATGDRAGLPQAMVRRIVSRLAVLNAATQLRQIGLPGYGLHPLKGNQQGRWSISVTGAWRLTFRWESGDVLELDLEQYH